MAFAAPAGFAARCRTPCSPACRPGPQAGRRQRGGTRTTRRHVARREQRVAQLYLIMNIVQHGTIGFTRGRGRRRSGLMPHAVARRLRFESAHVHHTTRGCGDDLSSKPARTIGPVLPGWPRPGISNMGTGHMTRRRGGNTLMTVKVASGLGEPRASGPRRGGREPGARVSGKGWRGVRPALALRSGWPSEMLPTRFESGPRYWLGVARNPAQL